MSSLYKANTFCSQYQPTSPFILNGAFAEQTSLALASSFQRKSVYSTNTTPFFTLTPSSTAHLPGSDTNSESLSTQSQSGYSSPYNLGDGNLDMHCSPLENPVLTAMCAADTSSCSMTDHRYFHQQEDNLRLYPWMRIKGLWELVILKDTTHIYVRRGNERRNGQMLLLTVAWGRHYENFLKSVCCFLDILYIVIGMTWVFSKIKNVK